MATTNTQLPPLVIHSAKPEPGRRKSCHVCAMHSLNHSVCVLCLGLQAAGLQQTHSEKHQCKSKSCTHWTTALVCAKVYIMATTNILLPPLAFASFSYFRYPSSISIAKAVYIWSLFPPWHCLTLPCHSCRKDLIYSCVYCFLYSLFCISDHCQSSGSLENIYVTPQVRLSTVWHNSICYRVSDMTPVRTTYIPCSCHCWW